MVADRQSAEPAAASPYDAVAYPTAIFIQTHPDRLAALARLHGLSPADPASARVLEIACGDGMNLLAMAAAAPAAEFHGFDLAPTVIARGRARAEAAGLANVRLEVRDLLDAGLDGEFDYVIVHGLYAWVPPAVRQAIFPLVARVLAPYGIAFVSYNTLPGGYLRMGVRDLMRHYIRDGSSPEAILKVARSVLEEFAEPRPDDGPGMAAFRHQARRTLDQPDGLLFHDELGEHYHPQRHCDVAAEAAANGLEFLTDSGRGRFDDGFLPEGVEESGDVQARIVRLAQERDFEELRYFRRSLFVRAGLEPSRTVDPARIRPLWATSCCAREGDSGNWRSADGGVFEVHDPALAAALDRLAEARPGRLPIAQLDLDDPRLSSLLHLFDLGAVELHVGPAPFAVSAPDRPTVSPLARAMLGEGLDTLCTLNHSTVRIADPALRRFLAGLDGSRGSPDLRDLAAEAGFSDPDQWPQALGLAVSKALLALPGD